jgi:nucleoside-diphosphate-sugar epimerase
MTTDKIALILGATGGIGGEVARLLKTRGWTVRGLHRDAAGMTARSPGFTWIQGDAMRAGDVIAAARGTALIVHAVNPPGYRDWDKLVLPMLDSTIAAARAAGARILLPGTIYNYGPDAFPDVDETSAQNPITRKGAIRVEMERRLRVAATAGTPVLVVRAGDFFGPNAANNWFSQGLVKPGRTVTSVGYPGKLGIGHLWAYLPDVAETMIRLVGIGETLPPFETFHMEGHWDEDGTGMIAAIRRAVGNPRLKVRPLPWRLLALASPFVPLFRELLEMRYLWETPVHMNNARLVSTLGREPHTPLDDAVQATLAGLDCVSA